MLPIFISFLSTDFKVLGLITDETTAVSEGAKRRLAVWAGLLCLVTAASIGTSIIGSKSI